MQGGVLDVVLNVLRPWACLTYFSVCSLWRTVPLVTGTNFFFPGENFAWSFALLWEARRSPRETDWAGNRVFRTFRRAAGVWGQIIFDVVTRAERDPARQGTCV